MFGRKNGLIGVCIILLPAVTVGCRRDSSRPSSSKQCKYMVQLTTGDEENAGTNDDIQIRIRKDGPWHSLDTAGHDDFERGHMDTFKFEDVCVDKYQNTTIGSAGNAKFLTCFSDKWLVTQVSLAPLDIHWINSWRTHKWLYCHDTLELKTPKPKKKE